MNISSRKRQRKDAGRVSLKKITDLEQMEPGVREFVTVVDDTGL